jgi:hypothetical protein
MAASEARPQYRFGTNISCGIVSHALVEERFAPTFQLQIDDMFTEVLDRIDDRTRDAASLNTS